MKNKIKQEKAITLIALVVTIIVLLILAGVSISMLAGDNSILRKATEARKMTDEVALKEEQQLADLESEMNGTSTGTSEGYDYTSKVNAPELKEGMIPITYKSNKWIVADKSNKDKSWYNYDYACIGHAFSTFALRGGDINAGASAGVLYSGLTYGYGGDGFRASLAS